jgi:Na+/H+ antiporter NhaD/arsenite permease-like protein
MQHRRHAASETRLATATRCGSAANIIVVEKARTETHISFLGYMKIGVPVTVVTLAIGLVWLTLVHH